MAIYHLHARAGSRGGGGRTGAGRVIKGKAAGQSARAKAAYNLRVQEYAANRHELAYVASGNMPAWADDALGYWEATDTHERAKATLFREVEFALPHELPAAERHRLAHEFMSSICDAQGLPYLLTVHEKEGNPHAHGLISERMHDGYDRTPETWFRRAANQGKEPGTGGARKARLGQDGSWLQSTRATWAAMCNNALELHGHAVRIDHRTLEAQGITDRLPQIHLGPHLAEMEARGIRTDRAEMAMEIEETNKRMATQAKALEDTHGQHLGQDTSGPERGASGPGAGAPDRGPGHDSGRLSPGHGPGLGAGPDLGAGGGQGPDRGRSRMAEGPGEGRGVMDGSGPEGPGRRQSDAGSLGQGQGHVAGLDAPDGPHGVPGGPDRGGSRDRILDLAATSAGAVAADQPRRGAGRGNVEGGRMAGAWNKNKTAVERQLQGMGCERFEIGILDPKKGMLVKEWDRATLMDSLPWLKRENAKGADIYVRPAREERAALVLIDDVNLATLDRMRGDGLCPAVVVQTSPGNYQGWVRLAEKGQQMDEAARTWTAKHIAREYGADPNSADYHHFGRLAGFTNRKPQHVNRQGQSPFVTLDAYNGKPAKRAAEVVEEAARSHAVDRDREVRAQIREHPAPERGGDLGAWYREIWFQMELKWEKDFDRSRADWYLACVMVERKHDLATIAKVMREHSPELDRKTGHVDDYLVRTIGKAKAWSEAAAKGEKWEVVKDQLLERSAQYREQIMELPENHLAKAAEAAPARGPSRGYGMGGR